MSVTPPLQSAGVPHCGGPRHGGHRVAHSSRPVRPELTENRITVRPCQTLADGMTALGEEAGYDLARALVGLEGDADLGVDDVVEDAAPGIAATPAAIPRAAATSPSTRSAHPLAPARRAPPRSGRRGPGGRSPGPPRSGSAVGVQQVAGMHSHRRLHGAGVGDDRDAAVVGRVEGLVRVGRPGVGAGQTVGQRGGAGRPPPRARTRRRRAPRRRRRGRPDRGPQGVEGTGVDVARLQADDRRAAVPAAPRRRASGSSRPWSSTATRSGAPSPR